jgi:Zn finger protein HypA/HybF involved in hydrogenase expression
MVTLKVWLDFWKDIHTFEVVKNKRYDSEVYKHQKLNGMEVALANKYDKLTCIECGRMTQLDEPRYGLLCDTCDRTLRWST